MAPLLRPYLKALAKDVPSVVRDAVSTIIAAFNKKVVPTTADGQVTRAANRFGLIAAAGELATSFGLTGWTEDEAFQAAIDCFQVWLKQRGGHGPKEEQNALQQVRYFLEANGQSRFQDWEPRKDNWNQPIERTVTNRAGFRRETSDGIEHYVFPEAFKNDLCQGLDHKFVAQLLI